MKQTFLNSINELDQKINQLLSVDKTERDNVILKALRDNKDAIIKEYIELQKPCNEGDIFKCVSAGGRSIIGEAHQFRVFKGDVIVESYYPVVKGVRKSTLAYFSVPYIEFVKL